MRLSLTFNFSLFSIMLADQARFANVAAQVRRFPFMNGYRSSLIYELKYM